MNSATLHRFHHRARRSAALAVAVFALNWIGLALAPCAMAFEVAPVAQHAAAHEHCPHCPPADVPPCHGDDAPRSNEACGAVPKPAIEAREAKLAAAPLVIALSGPLLVLEPVPVVERRGYAAADPAPRAELAAPDRYCRRLE